MQATRVVAGGVPALRSRKAASARPLAACQAAPEKRTFPSAAQWAAVPSVAAFTALPAFAEEAATAAGDAAIKAAAAPVLLGFTQAELYVIGAPAVLYAGWRAFNAAAPKAGLAGYLQFVLIGVIAWNCFSIVYLNVRYF